MKVFACPVCNAAVYFDNVACVQCGSLLAYDVEHDRFAAGAVLCLANATVEACNWSVPDSGYCRSCALDVQHEPTEKRAPFERAKRRAVRQLERFGVDLHRPPTLRFDLRDGSVEGPVTIGHQDGVIALDTAEADPARREEVRTGLGEPYRSPLGHVRHELGHWYWAAYVGDRFSEESFRGVFGDERADYAEAIERHYGTPDDGSWQSQYVSFYASMHPWEDFAESFAHLLHVTDTLETAAMAGMVGGAAVALGVGDFDLVYQRWIDVSVALNELNRSMGTPDAYPFAPSQPAINKLHFVWDALTSSAA